MGRVPSPGKLPVGPAARRCEGVGDVDPDDEVDVPRAARRQPWDLGPRATCRKGSRQQVVRCQRRDRPRRARLVHETEVVRGADGCMGSSASRQAQLARSLGYTSQLGHTTPAQLGGVAPGDVAGDDDDRLRLRARQAPAAWRSGRQFVRRGSAGSGSSAFGNTEFPFGTRLVTLQPGRLEQIGRLVEGRGRRAWTPTPRCLQVRRRGSSPRRSRNWSAASSLRSPTAGLIAPMTTSSWLTRPGRSRS